MTEAEARERAKEVVSSVTGGADYYGRLWDSIAEALLTVQQETAERCAGIADKTADECAEYGNIVGRVVADEVMLSIRREFGVKP